MTPKLSARRRAQAAQAATHQRARSRRRANVLAIFAAGLIALMLFLYIRAAVAAAPLRSDTRARYLAHQAEQNRAVYHAAAEALAAQGLALAETNGHYTITVPSARAETLTPFAAREIAHAQAATLRAPVRVVSAAGQLMATASP
jgi:hypothetical protein